MCLHLFDVYVLAFGVLLASELALSTMFGWLIVCGANCDFSLFEPTRDTLHRQRCVP